MTDAAPEKPVTPESIAKLRAALDRQIKIDCGKIPEPPAAPAVAYSHEETSRLLKLRKEWLHCLAMIGLRCPKEDPPTIERFAAQLAAADAECQRLQREGEELRKGFRRKDLTNRQTQIIHKKHEHKT
jgi:hypothetical protein